MSNTPTPTLPMNSMVLVFEAGSIDAATAIAAPDLVGVLSDILHRDLRAVVKWGNTQAGEFDFSPLVDSGVPLEHVRSVVDLVVSGIHKSLDNRGVNLERLSM